METNNYAIQSSAAAKLTADKARELLRQYPNAELHEDMIIIPAETGDILPRFRVELLFSDGSTDTVITEAHNECEALSHSLCMAAERVVITRL